MLDLAHIQFMVGENTVLQNVSAAFASGQLTAIVGPNGAGKTSLLRVAAGLAAVSGGTISASGAFEDDGWRSQNIAYMPQFQSVAWPLTAREIVRLGLLPFAVSEAEAHEKTEAALARCGVQKFADRSIDSLSGGEQARVYLARLLVGGAKALLLDEPTQSLDAAGALSVLNLLRAEADNGVAIGLVLHDLNLARRFCDHVVVLQNGHVAASGAPQDVLSPDVVRPIFGVTFSASGKNGYLIPERPL